MLNKFLMMLFIAVVAISCKSKKTGQEAIKTKPVVGVVSTESILAKQTHYKTFTAKAKTSLSLSGKNHDVTLNVRNKKGEIIWISATYIAGIEVARLMITPDSVKLMNRISSEYIAKPFSFINSYTVPEIDFESLEAIFIGNPLEFTLDKSSKITKQDNAYLVEGKKGKLEYQNTYSKQLKPQTVQLKNQELRQNLKLEYNKYTVINSKIVPLQLLINSVINTQNINLTIEYQNPQFDVSQDYPFNVPKRFTIIE